MDRTGAQIIWECLLREGVETVFGYPGGAILPTYDAMTEYPIRHVLVRHEQSAVHMADGFARASGRTGVVVATSGPGATNLVTGLAKRASLVAGLDEATAAKVSIAVDEAVTNVILHAYRGEGEHSVELELRFTEKALEVHIWHTGQGIHSDQLVLPDPKEYIKHPRKGGLGLLLMSRFMDEVQFRADAATGRNECCLIKKIS